MMMMATSDNLENGDKLSVASESSNENSKQKHGTSSTGSISNSNDDNCKTAIRANLSKEGTSKVNKSRTLVLLILIVAATAICVVVFFVSKNTEVEQFQAQYEGIATKLFGSFEMLSSRMSSINSISSAGTIVGFNRTSNTTSWPFVTLPSFEQRAATALSLSLALEVSMYPIVRPQTREEWERYSVGHDKYWIKDGLDHQSKMGLTGFEPNAPPLDQVLMTDYTTFPIVDRPANRTYVVSDRYDPYFLPKWQTSPVLKKDRINVNLYTQQKTNDNINNLNFRYEDIAHAQNETGNAMRCVNTGKAIVSSFDAVRAGTIHDTNPDTARIATLKSLSVRKEIDYAGTILAMLYLPVYDTFEDNRKVVGIVTALIFWRNYLEQILPENVNGIIAVIENTCDGYYSFQINGQATVPLGFGNLHDPKFNHYNRSTYFKSETIVDGTKDGLSFDLSDCIYSLHIYPSDTLISTYRSSTPLLVTFSVAMVFAFTICTFLVYNHLVEKRQSMILSKAAHSTAIVSSLFPKQVRDRLLQDEQDEEKTKINMFTTGNRLKSYLTDETTTKNDKQVIADLFPNATVMFADIAGFTAWSSTRGPESVFVLLQTLYQGFDKIAKRRHVFKVETIGDCYLAVTGLPDHQPKHALIMARFAWECREKMSELMKQLEVQLGPDCSDLEMRFGIHSGPVTAGVLRGDRARFQLFGDTVNTAARMESTGLANMIHISNATANLLMQEGKSHWLKQRDDLVDAKGKGKLVTFWLNPNFQKNDISSSKSPSENAPSNSDLEGIYNTNPPISNDDDVLKRDRNVDWMVELLTEYIQKMIISNKCCVSGSSSNNEEVVYVPPKKTTCLDEFKEVIEMCKNDRNTLHDTDVELDAVIINDLRSYLSILARMYRSNAFHNFEHACHVTMSVSKLLKRIVTPEISAEDANIVHENGETALHSCLHKYTYGIVSDPLAQFAIVFSAIIHDVDHRGCSNAQLIVEEPLLGNRYRNKSVAEQNSIDLAWDLLMSDQFDSLRRQVFGSQAELLRFRQLIVNTVLATDIFDSELSALRKSRWEKAFSNVNKSESDLQNADIKATIVIEHIIQASDVAHTMQHWQIYQKWNKRLFHEMYLAFLVGRMSTDPSSFWYHGELSFFDNYIIPLAKKLKECNVFGVSGDEYLNYAVNNRSEWEQRGKSIVEEMIGQFSNKEDNLP